MNSLWSRGVQTKRASYWQRVKRSEAAEKARSKAEELT
jgi:hypothetical protein